MYKKEEILQRINGYSVSELFEHIQAGIVTKDELYHYGLAAGKRPELDRLFEAGKKEQEEERARWEHVLESNDISSYRNYYRRYGEAGFDKVDNGCWENYAQKNNTIKAYKDYMGLFAGYSDREDKKGKHYFDAEDEIERLNAALKEERRQLLTDMLDHPYKPIYKTWDSLQQYFDRGLITKEILIEEGIVPEALYRYISLPDQSMPQMQIQKQGQMSSGRTEIYFLGIPRSGKSAVLASFIHEASNGRFLDYIRNKNEEGVDHSEDYFYALISTSHKLI